MLEPIILQIQWPHRKEDAESCAARMKTSLELLETLSPVFQHWVKTPRSRSRMVDAVPLNHHDVQELAKVLLAGRNRNDAPPREVIEELGFAISLWNKDSGGTDATYYTHCGNYAQNIPYNGVNIGIGQFKPPILPAAGLVKLLKQILEIWEANLGVIYFQNGAFVENYKRVFLAHYSIPGTDFNDHWPKIGQIVEQFQGGELRVDTAVAPMFDSGVF